MFKTSISPASGYEKAKETAKQLKAFCLQSVSQMDTAIDGRLIIAIASNMDIYKKRFNVIKVIPGIAAYAQAQEDNPAYDVAGEFASLQAALNTALATVTAVNTNALITGWGANGVTYATFTPAQTASLKANLQAIADLIE